MTQVNIEVGKVSDLLYDLMTQTKAKECFVYWNSDSAMWVKERMVFPTSPPVPQAELQDAEVQPINTD